MNHFARGPEIRTARGKDKRAAEEIRKLEAQGLEKHFDNEYIICFVELARVVLLEQSYHSLTMVRGKHYAK